MTDTPDDVPNTGRAVKLYVPQSPGANWAIGVDRFPKSRPTGHPDVAWSAVWWGCEIRMPEDYLRSFVRHAAATLRMGPDEFAPVPPASVPSMDAPPSGFVTLFGESVAVPIFVPAEHGQEVNH